jgi:hypothetical protein
MKLEVSTKKLSNAGVARVEEVLKKKAEIRSAEWIVAASWDGYRVAAFPISTLNPAAPPEIAVEDNGWHQGGVPNKKPVAAIVKKLKRHCPSEKLEEAVQLVKNAVEALSS